MDRWRTSDYSNVMNSVDIIQCNCNVTQIRISSARLENVSNVFWMGGMGIHEWRLTLCRKIVAHCRRVMKSVAECRKVLQSRRARSCHKNSRNKLSRSCRRVCRKVCCKVVAKCVARFAQVYVTLLPKVLGENPIFRPPDFSELIGAFSSLAATFWGRLAPIPQSHGERAESAPQGASFPCLTPFGPSPCLPSPRSDVRNWNLLRSQDGSGVAIQGARERDPNLDQKLLENYWNDPKWTKTLGKTWPPTGYENTATLKIGQKYTKKYDSRYFWCIFALFCFWGRFPIL